MRLTAFQMVIIVSLCMWYGIIWSAMAVTRELAPVYASVAKYGVQETYAKTQKRVSKKLAQMLGWQSL